MKKKTATGEFRVLEKQKDGTIDIRGKFKNESEAKQYLRCISYTKNKKQLQIAEINIPKL